MVYDISQYCHHCSVCSHVTLAGPEAACSMVCSLVRLGMMVCGLTYIAIHFLSSQVAIV